MWVALEKERKTSAVAWKIMSRRPTQPIITSFLHAAYAFMWLVHFRKTVWAASSRYLQSPRPVPWHARKLKTLVRFSYLEWVEFWRLIFACLSRLFDTFIFLHKSTELIDTRPVHDVIADVKERCANYGVSPIQQNSREEELVLSQSSYKWLWLKSCVGCLVTNVSVPELCMGDSITP